jgi:excisionase family DNA binding protein
MAALVRHEGMVPVGEIKEDQLGKLRRVLSMTAKRGSTEAVNLPKLVGSNREEMLLPEPIYRLLCELIPHLRRGETVFMFPESKSLTTQEAADMLGMSRPYLKKLLDEEVIPYFRVGSHRRIYVRDIAKYRNQRDIERHRQVDEILATSEDMGVYA